MYLNSIRTGKWFLLLALCVLVCSLFAAPLAAQSAGIGQGDTVQNNPAELVSLQNDDNDELQAEEGNGLLATMKQGGPLMILLVILAFISLTIIIERLTYYTRNKVWNIKSMEEMLQKIPDSSQARYREDLEDELRSAFVIYAGKLERGLALLSGVGNIAPIVGFLGTVLGMIQAFAAIAAASTVNAKVVAVGIQIALTTTAGGLIVAAPTLIVFYLLSHLIQNRYAKAEEVIPEIASAYPRLSDTVEKPGNER